MESAAYESYALPLKRALTTGGGKGWRRGYLLRLSCSFPDGSQAHGVGEIASLAGVYSLYSRALLTTCCACLPERIFTAAY